MLKECFVGDCLDHETVAEWVLALAQGYGW